MRYWLNLNLVRRIRLIRYIIPIVLIPIVIVYQLQVAVQLEEQFGHPIHYAAEIGFYSLVGPVVTWLTLIWVERRLEEKETLEKQVQAHTRQLSSLTAASSDAILGLDENNNIVSWNQGASKLLGYGGDEVLGTKLEKHFPEISAVVQSQTTKTVEKLILTKGHQPRQVSMTYTILTNQDIGINSGLLILRDITYRSERAAILEEERGRISRDLHDGVAQTLYFLALKADMTQEGMETNREGAIQNLKEIGIQARTAIRDVRRAIFGLRPLDWSEKNFLSTLETFCKTFCAELGIRLDFKINPPETLIPDWLEPTIFRIIQEALNNVAKHAQGSKIDIQLTKVPQENRILLIIKDDGVGFTPENTKRGLGLEQMKNRVERYNGIYSIQSDPDKGTTIFAEIPLAGDRRE
jgi:PAS domain S-box-containing protein